MIVVSPTSESRLKGRYASSFLVVGDCCSTSLLGFHTRSNSLLSIPHYMSVISTLVNYISTQY